MCFRLFEPFQRKAKKDVSIREESSFFRIELEEQQWLGAMVLIAGEHFHSSG